MLCQHTKAGPKRFELLSTVLETAMLTITPETYKYLFYLTRIFGLEPKHHFRDYYLFSGQMPCQLGLYSQFNDKSRIRTYGAFTPSGFQDQRFKPDSAILPYLY